MIYYLVLVFFVLDYLRPGSYIPGLDILRLNAIIPACAILATLVRKTPVANRDYFADVNAKIMGTLLGLLIISIPFATVTLTAYTVAKNVFAYMLISWVLVRNVGDRGRLQGVFMMLAGVHVAIAALNPALFTNPDSRVGINSGAFLGDGNDYSLSVNICIPLLLFVMLESKRKVVKVGWAVALLSLCLAVVATKSRGGTLAFGAVMLYFWIGSQRKAFMAMMFVLVIGVVLALAPPMYFERMGQIADTQEGAAAGRIDAWKEGVKMAARNPLLGAGAGQFPLAYGASTMGPWMTAHSIYFLLLGELGVPGLAVLLTFIFANLAANRRMLVNVHKLPPAQALTAHNLLNCTSAALIAFATGGAFLSAAYYPHMYVLAAFLTSSRYAIRCELEALEHAEEERAPVVLPVKSSNNGSAISPEWVPPPRLYAHDESNRYSR